MIITSEKADQIRARVAAGELVAAMAAEYGISLGYAYYLIGGIKKLNQREKLVATMRAAGIEISSQNIAICRGHSDAWIRMSASRFRNRLALEIDPVNAIQKSQILCLRAR